MPVEPVSEKSKQQKGITGITVCGFKSLYTEKDLEIKPLTLLAGENNSGKSSIMQPILLMKQTLESKYDPGALLLNGPNVRFTKVNQLLSYPGGRECGDSFYVGMKSGDRSITAHFKKKEKIFIIKKADYSDDEGPINLKPGMQHSEVAEIEHPVIQDMLRTFEKIDKAAKGKGKSELSVEQDRCFLTVVANIQGGHSLGLVYTGRLFQWEISRVIHVPAARGNPQRSYPVTGVGPTYPGTFGEYVGGIIAYWQEEEKDKLKQLTKFLRTLGLTWTVKAKQIDATQIVLRVGQLKTSSKSAHEVNIADAGFGLSQCMPVLVALLAADEGQMVYLEEPEIHLHPNAQFELAKVLAYAVSEKGVKVVVETHSSYLLLGLQTLIAKGELSSDLVSLNWFERDELGETIIRKGSFDKIGRYGEWPVKFDDILLKKQKEYYDAVRRKLRKEKQRGIDFK